VVGTYYCYIWEENKYFLKLVFSVLLIGNKKAEEDCLIASLTKNKAKYTCYILPSWSSAVLSALLFAFHCPFLYVR